MKYGILFLTLGVLILYLAFQWNGWFLLLLWPAANSIAIGASYLIRSPRIFGKQNTGTIHPAAFLFLLPYLIYVGFLWHCIRLTSSEPSFNYLDETIVIGRRLIPREQTITIDNYVDLTCEFNEPPEIVRNVNYVSFPILDASTPASTELKTLVNKIDSLNGVTYIHCAQGHGHTGVVTAALLMSRETELSASDAISQIQSVRPALSCNREQMEMLNQLRNAG